MDIDCPNCKASLPSSMIKDGESELECPFCMKTFHIKKKIEVEPDSQIQEIPPLSGELPPGNKIFLQNTGLGEYYLKLRGTNYGTAIFFIIFATFWNGMLSVFTVGLISGEIPWLVALFMTPFWLIGMGTAIIALYLLFGCTEIFIDTKEFRLKRSLFGFSYNKNLPAKEIDLVRQVEIYSQNKTPVYGVGVFAGSRKAKFGSQLNETEKNWMIEFLQKAFQFKENSE